MEITITLRIKSEPNGEIFGNVAWAGFIDADFCLAGYEWIPLIYSLQLGNVVKVIGSGLLGAP